MCACVCVCVYVCVCVCVCVSGEIRFDISCKFAVRQTIHMKCKVLFSLKKNYKNRMSPVGCF